MILIGGCAAVAGATDLRTLNLTFLDAAKQGELTLVQSKLLDGASIDSRDRFGNTALIYAARGAHVEIAQVLVEAGANPNQANVNGNTPLFEAAGSGDIELVQFILEQGSDPNAVNIKHVSPLANAVFHRHVDIAELLLQRGARADLVDDTGKSSAVYAAANGETEILRRILDSATEPAVVLNTRYAHDLTLLMWAAGYGNSDAVKMLIDRGAEFDLTDDRGKSALMMAAENGHADVVRLSGQFRRRCQYP